MACDKCRGTGWYFSQNAQIERQGPGGSSFFVEVPGMVVCLCPAGARKNQAIGEHGEPKKKKSKREEF